MDTKHAKVRRQQRCISPLIDQWLDQYGEDKCDGRGGIIRFFSHASIRSMESAFGRALVRKLSEYFDAYKIESSKDCNASQKPDSLLSSLSPENTFIF